MRGIRSYHPISLAIYSIAVLIIAMFINHPIIQGLSLTGAILFYIVLKQELKASKFGFYLSFFMIIAFTNPIFSHKGVTPLFFLNGNPFTLESLLYGINLGTTIVAIGIWFSCFKDIFDNEKLLYLFGKISPKLALLLSMTLRFIPMIIRQTKTMINAQTALGMFENAGYIKKIKIYAEIFISVIVWSFEKSIDISSSMKSRGYGIGKRSLFSTFKFKKNDTFFIIVTIILWAICIGALNFGGGVFSYYPQITKIGNSTADIALYIAYGVLVFVPFFTEIKEVVLWKYCVSKI